MASPRATGSGGGSGSRWARGRLPQSWRPWGSSRTGGARRTTGPPGPRGTQALACATAPAPRGRSWGFASQLYSLRSRRSWGHGDLRDLADLAAWSARARCRFRPDQPAVRRRAAAPGEPVPLPADERKVHQPALPADRRTSPSTRRCPPATASTLRRWPPRSAPGVPPATSSTGTRSGRPIAPRWRSSAVGR